jgi:hypothetical protein
LSGATSSGMGANTMAARSIMYKERTTKKKRGQ